MDWQSNLDLFTGGGGAAGGAEGGGGGGGDYSYAINYSMLITKPVMLPLVLVHQNFTYFVCLIFSKQINMKRGSFSL